MTEISKFEEEVNHVPLTGVPWFRQRIFCEKGWTYWVHGTPPVAKLDGYPRRETDG